jgi:hypothetical protein
MIIPVFFTAFAYGTDWLDQLSDKNRVLDQNKQKQDQEFKRELDKNLVNAITICRRLKTNYKFSSRAVTLLALMLRSDPSTIRVQNIELRLNPLRCIGVFTYPRGIAFCPINTNTVTEENVINELGECQ